jgi:hypothetical protein
MLVAVLVLGRQLQIRHPHSSLRLWLLSNLASSNGGALTNLTGSNVTGTVALASNVTGTIAISNGGSGATTAGGARTNLGGTTVGNAVFTATNAAAAADAIGLGATNQVGFDSVQANDFTVSDGGTISFEDTGSIEFGNAAGPTRTNLGLGWSALTNTSTAGFNTSLYGSGTNPVLYNTNGEVVSPTNFWQVAPIVTRFVESQPTTSIKPLTSPQPETSTSIAWPFPPQESPIPSPSQPPTHLMGM